MSELVKPNPLQKLRTITDKDSLRTTHQDNEIFRGRSLKDKHNVFSSLYTSRDSSLPSHDSHPLPQNGDGPQPPADGVGGVIQSSRKEEKASTRAYGLISNQIASSRMTFLTQNRWGFRQQPTKLGPRRKTWPKPLTEARAIQILSP